MINLKELVPKMDPKLTDIALYFIIFEQQAEKTNILADIRICFKIGFFLYCWYRKSVWSSWNDIKNAKAICARRVKSGCIYLMTCCFYFAVLKLFTQGKKSFLFQNCMLCFKSFHLRNKILKEKFCCLFLLTFQLSNTHYIKLIFYLIWNWSTKLNFFAVLDVFTRTLLQNMYRLILFITVL